MFKFLHAADIHLDSPLRGLDRYEGAPVDEIRGATRKALINLVDVAISEEVAFVVLAGDLYDGDWKDFDTGLFFVKQMRRLREADIPVLGVHGNHDAANKMTRNLPLPENVYFFSTAKAETHRFDGLDVVVHGQSFAKHCTTADLAKEYPPPVPGCFNLGVLHTSMSGREGHDSYAPCSEGCLRESGYDYWALGHIHQREVVGSNPVIAYSGNIQGRHIREAGPKGCLLVHVADDHTATPRFEPLDVLRWEVVNVSLDGVEEKGEVLERVAEELRLALENSEGRTIVARVVFVGATPLADTIASAPRQWTADVRAVSLDVGADSLWVEKVKNEAHRHDERETPDGDDSPLAELTTMVAELSRSETIVEELNMEFGDLERKLPTEISDAVRMSDNDWWRGILHDAEAKVFEDLRGVSRAT